MITKNLLKIFFSLSMIYSILAYAGVTVVDHSTMPSITSLYNDARAQAPNVLKALHQAAIDDTMNNTKKPQKPRVFVSLGMPDNLLRQIFHDAALCDASVVIRGLYNNSFDATLKRLFALMPKDEQEKKAWRGVLINPLWFREYQVDSVPAVVMTYDDDYDILFGNIAVKDAIAILKKHHQEVMT